ncbi:VOC family protein [Alkalihalobacillus sp. R86527]|uniref:VOC family protein n=1 Tax=Alkalihalobacillus sp. R86527 TaxID=3093863 RepID=UPI00367363F1
MSTFISHVATVEIPVKNLQTSIAFYQEVLGVELHFQGDRNAMLTFNKKGVPTIFLVETASTESISFHNSHTEVIHSIIDFYTHDLEGFYHWLKEKQIEVGSYNANPDNGFGGFGFKDPDGNLLSATNILHPGQ